MDDLGEVPVAQLRELIDFHEAVMEVSTGDVEADESYRQGAQAILGDLKALCGLLPKVESDDEVHDEGRPFIPVGFKLHLVRH